MVFADFFVRLRRFERLTYSSGGCRSIQLSYRRMAWIYCDNLLNEPPRVKIEPTCQRITGTKDCSQFETRFLRLDSKIQNYRSEGNRIDRRINDGRRRDKLASAAS